MVQYSEDLGVEWEQGLGKEWQVQWKRHKVGQMDKGKGPPADSGSFCEAEGVVSEAYEGGAPNELLNEATEPMGAR